MSQEAIDPAGRSEKSRWLGFAQLALILLAIVVALYFARAPSRVERAPISGPAQAMPVVSIVKPAPTEHILTVNLTGSVTLERKATVVSEAVGRVIWVSPKFSNGGSIAANEVFVRIDPAQFALEVQAAEMAVAEADARVQIEKARAKDGAGPSVAGAEAGLGKARAALALAELRLARAEISLPYASRVVSSDLEVGDLVGPPEAVGRLSTLGVVYRPGALQVRVPIKAEDLEDLAPAVGRSARVRAGGGVFEATVVRVSSTVAPKTRLSALFLKFSKSSSPAGRPVPGTFAQVEVVGPERGNVYVLPGSAARERDSVWVVRDGALRSSMPKTVARASEGWIVEAFDAGDGVVVGTLPGAREGLKVEAAQAPSSSQ